MSVKERDPLTGHQITGHEWNGIKELNTRVPRVVWFFIAVTHVWAVFYWILMPAWPIGESATPGLLGLDQQEMVREDLEAAQLARADWKNAIATLPFDEIRADPDLMAHVARSGPALYGDNCAMCHGTEGAGARGFPSLVDDAWLWGGEAETIADILRVGINAEHPQTRNALMLAYGANNLLNDDQIKAVVAYVQSLSGGASDAPEAQLSEGETIYAAQCVACHGAEGLGIQAVGAPNLVDDHWIYGGDDASMFETIYAGRQGWMPHWEDRLTLAQRKMLALYVQDLGETP